MNIMEKLKNFGQGFIGFIIFIGLILLALLFIKGGVWLSAVIYPWLVVITGITFIISLIILLPLAIFKKTRTAAALGLLIASHIFSATLWVWSFLLVYSFWGFLGLLIGLVMGGVGVVPVAMIASILKGEWGIFGQIILNIVIIFGIRFFVAYLTKERDRKEVGQIVCKRCGESNGVISYSALTNDTTRDYCKVFGDFLYEKPFNLCLLCANAHDSFLSALIMLSIEKQQNLGNGVQFEEAEKIWGDRATGMLALLRVARDSMDSARRILKEDEFNKLKPWIEESLNKSAEN